MFKPIILILLLLTFTSCGKTSIKSPPKAVKGVIDLSNWDFQTDGPVKLRGEWSFYYNKLISPDEILSKNENRMYMNIPGAWNHYKVDGKNLNSFGFATYVLKLTGIKEIKKKMALDVREIFTASRVFFVPTKNVKNIKPLIASGNVVKGGEKAVAQLKHSLAEITDFTGEGYIVIHVSNFVEVKAGPSTTITLGPKDVLESEKNSNNFLKFFVLGILFIMAAYHIGLFYNRSESWEYLYFALVCLFIALRLFITSRLINHFYIEPSNLKFELLTRSVYSTVYISLPLFYTFLSYVFKDEFSVKLKKIIWYISVFMILLSIVLPIRVFAGVPNNLYLLIAVFYLIVSLYYMFKAALNKRLGSYISIFSILIIIVFTVNDILVANGLFGMTVFLLPYALVIFIFSHSLILSQKFAMAFNDLERTTKEKVSLEELDKQKTLFFQNISHELRTPLTLIMTPLDEIRKSVKENKYIDMAIKNSNRLYRLVNQLLDFQKISAGKKAVVLVPINLQKFLSGIATNFKHTCQIKGLNFSFENLANKDLYILGEVDSLEKIVFNYLSNALKNTSQGGDIILRLKKNDENIRISVNDTGIGISEENQEKLFKVFTQVDESSNREYEGTGLGLALVKELTSKLGGNVGVRSTPGQGSTFYVEFPEHKHMENEKEVDLASYKPKEWHLAESGEIEKESDSDEIPEGDGELILVVDDLKDMRDLLSHTLKKKNFRVITARNGVEGLEKAKRFEPDLLIIDWMMPEKNGIELLSDLKNDGNLALTPTIMLTAKSDEESKLLGTKTGASAYLGKPFDEIELTSLVKNLLELKSKEKSLENMLYNQQKHVNIGMLFTDISHEMKNICVMAGMDVEYEIQVWLNAFKLLSYQNPLWKKYFLEFEKRSGFKILPEEEYKLNLLDKTYLREYKLIASEINTSSLNREEKDLLWKEVVLMEKTRLRPLAFLIETFTKVRSSISINKQMMLILDSILGYARESSSENQFKPELLVNSLMTLVEKNMSKNRIKIIPNIALDRDINANYSEIFQVLLNLVLNACDALNDYESEEKRIEIKIYEKNSFIYIETKDNGPGIAKDIQERIFDKNFSTKGDKGNGLGLYISKDIVNRNGGEIKLKSNPGETVFSIELK